MLDNKKFKRCFFLFLMTLFFLATTQKIEAQIISQWLYYPADAISVYGTPSIFISPPPALPGGTLPYNILGTAPSILVPPPLPVNTAASVAPTASTLLSRIALTIISPLTPSLLPAIPPAVSSAYNLFYPAIGALGTASSTLPSLFVAPPAATGVGTLPYNLYYPPSTTTPGLFILPPV